MHHGRFRLTYLSNEDRRYRLYYIVSINYETYASLIDKLSEIYKSHGMDTRQKIIEVKNNNTGLNVTFSNYNNFPDDCFYISTLNLRPSGRIGG